LFPELLSAAKAGRGRREWRNQGKSGLVGSPFKETGFYLAEKGP